MEWKEVRLGDVCNIITGFPFPGKKYSKEGIRVVRGDNVTIGNLRWDAEKDKRWNEPFDKTEYYSLQANDIVIGMDGSRVGKNKARIKEEDLPLLLAQRVACVRHNELAEQDYLYYNIFSKKFIDYVNSIHTGSAIPHISQKQIEDYKILLPDLETQRRIASILSSLDRKIELNNKINADLEEMAQAIFKNWFVDFEPFKDGKFVDSELGMIPEGWKVGKIIDIDCLITDYVSNGSFASLKQNVHLYEKKEYAQFIRNTDLKTNTFSVYVDKHSYDFLSKSTLYGNEIIISNVGDVGSVHLCPKLDIPMTLGNNIIMLRPNDKEYNYFLYLWFKYFSGQGLIQGIKGGSAQPKFNKTEFKNLPLLIPSFEIIERSYWIFESIFSILSSNVKENSRLSTLRDTLLPRLMSGELEVPE